MTRIFMNGKEIPREELRNYEFVYEGKRPVGLRKKEAKDGKDAQET